MVVQNKDQVLSLLNAHRRELQGFGVRRCGLFGSFLRGQQSSRSDIDLLVEFRPEQKSFDNFMRLAFFLEETLGRKVEMVTPESLSPYIGPRILREVEYAALDS
ncbi:MAG: nucleotidyltransferase [Acidobacteria bacterium 13_1_20CM_3_53_8]|nr:MAG: nucleotidyltransferase [Acidobacteria bacterium 13_1_20CM_3_53_8]